MQIKISEILNDLTNGLTRHDIKAKYNLSTGQMKAIFSNPLLKGKKTKKAEEPVYLVDDVTTVIATPVVEETAPVTAVFEPFVEE